MRPADAPAPVRALEDTAPRRAVRPSHHARPVREPIAYPWPETGLRKFNLGTIPASVTPPRTWRRAAWFAVGTATFVVLALGYAAVTLVGDPTKGTTIDALPGQPSQQLLITDLPIDATTGGSATSTRPTGSSGARPTTTTPPNARDAAGHRTSSGDAVPAQPARTTTNSGRPSPRPTTKAPPRSTVEPAPLAATDPETLGDRTELYYAQVVDNPQAAHRLTTGRLRAEGPEGIEARYADVKRIEVKKITIDPNWSYTRSVLVIVRKDGSTVTVERELTFSTGDDPKITSDSEPA